MEISRGKIILNFLDAHNAQIPHLDSTPRVEVENRALASLFTQLMGCAPMPTRDDVCGFHPIQPLPDPCLFC